jgi:hypothetical protein
MVGGGTGSWLVVFAMVLADFVRVGLDVGRAAERGGLWPIFSGLSIEYYLWN